MTESPETLQKQSPSTSKALNRVEKVNEMRKAVASVSEEDKKMFDAVSGAILTIQYFALSIILSFVQMKLEQRRLLKRLKKLEEQKIEEKIIA